MTSRALACAGWSPGFDLDIQQTFETKRQQIHTLQEGLPFGEVPVAPKISTLVFANAFFRSCATLLSGADIVRVSSLVNSKLQINVTC